MSVASSTHVRPPAAPAVRYGRWLSRGVWAVVDQALFSLGNFAVLMLLARWLTPGEFGLFTVAHTAFLLVATGYGAVVVEAMLVHGARRFEGRLPEYSGAVLLFQLPVALLAAMLIAAAGLICHFAHSAELSRTLFMMSAVTPLLLALWIARRPAYVEMQPHRAVVGGATYLMVVVFVLQVLVATGSLTTLSAMVALAVASVVATLTLLLPARIAWPGGWGDPIVREVARTHWSYGKWAMASGFLGMLPTQLCYLVLPEFSGVESAGALRAVSNLILPLIQINIALGGILMPAMARHRGTRHGRRITLAAAATTVLVPLVAWVMLGLLAEPLLALCYGESYAGFGWLVWMIGMTPALLGFSTLLNMILQARGRQDGVFYATLASALFAATAGVGLIAYDGLRGAAAGVNLSLVVATLVAGGFVVLGRPDGGPMVSRGEW